MRVPQRGERGSVMLVAMMIMASLLALGLLSVTAVLGGLSGATYDKGRSVAFYAAESGLTAGRDFLRRNFDSSTKWSAYVEPSNTTPQQPAAIVGNLLHAGDAGYPFTATSNASYTVTILNNTEDPGFVAGTDNDSRVIIRSQGFGPYGATVVLQVELGPGGPVQGGLPCAAYAQKNLSESGSGYNPCLENVEATGNVVQASPGAL